MSRTSQKSDSADAPQSRTANPAKNQAQSGTNCPPIATLLQLASKQKPTLLIATAESHAAAHQPVAPDQNHAPRKTYRVPTDSPDVGSKLSAQMRFATLQKEKCLPHLS